MYDALQESDVTLSSSSTSATNPSREFPPLPTYPSPAASTYSINFPPEPTSGMSQSLVDTIHQIFDGKKTFLDTVRERRKARQEMISRLFQRFTFAETDPNVDLMTNETNSNNEESPNTNESLARKSIHLHSTFDPNDDSQFQDEIERILNLEEDEEDEEFDQYQSILQSDAKMNISSEANMLCDFEDSEKDVS